MKNKFLVCLLINIFINVNCENRILLLSIPKCGTHLLAKCIELLTHKKLAGEFYPKETLLKGIPNFNGTHDFYRSHVPYLKKIENQLFNERFNAFFIYRDPRDQVVSNAYWIQSRKKLDINQIPRLITELIQDISNYYNKFLPWMNSKSVCSIKFENLIGNKGGGNDLLQRKEIYKICKFIGINSKHKINYTINNLYGGTFTFREGSVGGWAKHFSKDQKELFKIKAGHLLLNLGYEKDLNW